MCSHFVLFGAFKAFEASCFKGVTRLSPGYLLGVSICIEMVASREGGGRLHPPGTNCFENTPGLLWNENFKCVLRKFHRCF